MPMGRPMPTIPRTRASTFWPTRAGQANWWGIVTEDSQPSGKPVVQSNGDPFPGYYISTTSLVDPTKPVKSPAHYVDSAKVPYLALPRKVTASRVLGGARLGDFTAVVNTLNRKVA